MSEAIHYHDVARKRTYCGTEDGRLFTQMVAQTTCADCLWSAQRRLDEADRPLAPVIGADFKATQAVLKELRRWYGEERVPLAVAEAVMAVIRAPASPSPDKEESNQ